MMQTDKQRGFNLIEMSMVLVLIALLLGGVLKGREAIQDGKINRCQSDFKAIASAIYTYSSRYNALPGDDKKAGRWSGVTAGDGNGLIDGAWNSATVTDETRLAWLHLRASGLLKGKDTDAASHSFGGNIGIDQSLMKLSGTVICMENMPADVAEIIDNKLDDGNRDSGSVRGDTNPLLTTKPSASTYTSTNLYTLCYKI